MSRQTALSSTAENDKNDGNSKVISRCKSPIITDSAVLSFSMAYGQVVSHCSKVPNILQTGFKTQKAVIF